MKNEFKVSVVAPPLPENRVFIEMGMREAKILMMMIGYSTAGELVNKNTCRTGGNLICHKENNETLGEWLNDFYAELRVKVK